MKTDFDSTTFNQELARRARLADLMSDPILRQPLGYLLDHASHTLLVKEIYGKGYDVVCVTCHGA